MLSVKLYLKSGQTIPFKCESLTMDYNNETLEFCGYEIKGTIPKKVSFVPSQVAAYTIEE